MTRSQDVPTNIISDFDRMDNWYEISIFIVLARNYEIAPILLLHFIRKVCVNDLAVKPYSW